MFKSLLDLIYPIGSIYYNYDNPTHPADRFGGSWIEIKDIFLLPSNTAGNTGGKKEVILESNQIPKHTHSISDHTHSTTVSNQSVSHTHPIAHAHGVAAGAKYVTKNDGITIGAMKIDVGGTGSKPSGNYYIFKNKEDGVFAYPTKTGGTDTASSNVQSANHNHAVIVNKNTGALVTNEQSSGGGAHENMPPYRTCYAWYRSA